MYPCHTILPVPHRQSGSPFLPPQGWAHIALILTQFPLSPVLQHSCQISGKISPLCSNFIVNVLNFVQGAIYPVLSRHHKAPFVADGDLCAWVPCFIHLDKCECRNNCVLSYILEQCLGYYRSSK